MANSWIYDKAQSLVHRNKTRNLQELVNAMGIEVLLLIGSKHLLGMYSVIERNRYIFLSEDVSPQKNMILTHELGYDHLRLSVCKNCKPFQENKIFNPANRYELEANIFACHLLLSDEDVLRVLHSGQSDMKMAAELDAALLNVKHPQSDVLKSYTPEPEDWGGC